MVRRASNDHAEPAAELDPAGAAAIDDVFARHAGLIALAVAWTAMLGSLYFSEVSNFKPCKLCWYQRILMYPLALLLPVGLVRRDRGLSWYVVPLALLGLLVAGYHVLLQKTNWFTDSCAVAGEVPCSSDYIYWLGFITIPVLSLTAFVLILLTATAWRPAVGDPPAWPRVFGVIVAVGVLMALLWWLGWDPADPFGFLASMAAPPPGG